MSENLQERVNWNRLEQSLEEVPLDDRVRVIGDDAQGHFFIRFGTAFLITGDIAEQGGSDPAAAWRAMAQALAQDARVAGVGGEPATKDWSSYESVYPVIAAHREDLLSSQDVRVNLGFSDPIIFKLHVPRKNQTKIYDWTDIPTEDYWVAWDGVSISVLWECGAEEVYPPGNGGHIAFDVLRQAARVAGMDLIVQACSPGCSNMFGHTDVRVVQLPPEAAIESYAVKGGLALALLSVDGGPQTVLHEFAETLASPGAEFAQMKNRARRLLNVEGEARGLVAELLVGDYARLSRNTKGLKRRIKALGRRRKAKRTVASLWLAMADIEMLRRDWDRARAQFTDSATSRGVNMLFDIDRKDDDVQVSAIKLDFIRAAVEQQSNRMDNRMAAAVTGVGGAAAIVGAVVGAVVNGWIAG